MSLECDHVEVPEDVGELELCAVLTEGDLAIDITVDVNTICDEACCEPKHPNSTIIVLILLHGCNFS